MKLADHMDNSAGLRNRLAREYDEIDPKKVFAAMESCLKDVPKYLKVMIGSMDL